MPLRLTPRTLVRLSVVTLLVAFTGITAWAHSSVTSSLPRAVVESDTARNARMRWWREARFGMFIHWGLYSVAAGNWDGRAVGGVGEWILTHGQIPVAEYESLRDRFNPVDFDAKAWVSVARRAGMKYIVLTNKHHDGFCLWPSALTEWDVAATPFGRSGRDPIGELYEACEAAGIRLCLYHSIMDWHHPDYLPRRAWEKRPITDASFERYRDYLHGQLKELLERYPKIGVLWFDGEWETSWTHEDGCSLDDFVRSLNPAIIVNNRVDKGRAGMSGLTRGNHFRGDFGTPEQEIPAQGLPAGVDWESCMTMNDTWGFKEDDDNWKSADTLIRMLVDVASKGGNFLLNVGPDGRGRIPQPSIERLNEVGAWLIPRSEAIYDTRASPLNAIPWGRCTVRTLPTGGTRLYLFVFDWPADSQLRLSGVANDASRALVLGDPRSPSLRTGRDGDALIVDLSGVSRDGTCPVIAIDLLEAPIVTKPPSISARSSMFVEAIELTLEGAQPGQLIRFSLDGAEPRASSPVATAPIRIDRSCTVTARIFEGSTPRSETVRREFTRVVPRRAIEPPPSLGPGNGVRAVVFARDELSRVDDLDTATVVSSFGPTAIALDSSLPDAPVGVRFTGLLRVPADGVYHFVLESDDGSQLRIDHEVVVDNDGRHEARSVEGAVALAAGWHGIQVAYFNAVGDRSLRLQWEGPGIERGDIPIDALGWAP